MQMFDKIYCFSQYILIFLALLSSMGAVVYRLYSLNLTGVFIALILTLVFFAIIYKKSQTNTAKTLLHRPEEQEKPKQEFLSFLAYIFYLILIFHCSYIIFSNQTEASIISPWEVLPVSFFIIYALATLLLALNIINKNKYSLFLIILHYFLSFSAALIIFKIGFGFDPFIHRATLELIDKNGSVEPKPFYYLGYYSLIIILHKITFIKIILLEKLLVPLLAAFFLPLFLNKLLRSWFSDKVKINLTILALLILPFSIFTLSTPQSFAYLLFLLALISGLHCQNFSDLFLVALLSVSAFLVHPLAGIPAIFLVIFVAIFHSDNKKIKKYFYALFAFLSVLAAPVALLLSGKMNNGGQMFNFSKATEIFKLPAFSNLASENIILNSVYFFIYNYKYILFLIILAGIIAAWKHREACRIFGAYLVLGVAFFTSFLISSLVNFDSLIFYERANYANRLLIVSIMFLSPFIITALYMMIDRTSRQKTPIKIIFLLILCISITASLFANYPRFDNYHNSRGYSTGKADIEAVVWIEENKKNDNYIVLSNQQVSAAALYKYGFKKYYQNNIFYYPIPTGGELYQHYLDMVYEKADRETMAKAMELAGVNEAYFVLNKYWWAFPKILDEAKSSANSFEVFGERDVFVFKYTKD